MNIDKCELLASGIVQLREVLPSGQFHRSILAPGDLLPEGLPEDTKAVIQAHWTPERVSAYEAAKSVAAETGEGQ